MKHQLTIHALIMNFLHQPMLKIKQIIPQNSFNYAKFQLEILVKRFPFPWYFSRESQTYLLSVNIMDYYIVYKGKT